MPWVSLAALALAAMGFVAARRRAAWQLACGVLAAGALVLDLRAWVETVTLVALGHAVLAAAPGWRGTTRDARAVLREATAALGPSAALLLVLSLAAAATGQLGSFADGLRVAVPPDALSWLGWAAALVLLVAAVTDGARERARPPTILRRIVLAATVALLAARIAWIARVAALPAEVAWSEGPFLVNALKLAAHQPLYGPPADLDSYTYSPLVDLLHRALLAPLGLGLSLRASRVVVVAEQLGAGLVLTWSVDAFRAPERRWAIAPLGLACLASLVAPAVHPDHGVLLCTALAFALLVAEPRWPRWLFWGALVAVTPVAVAFKMTAAGLGMGLAAAFLVERRWKEVAALGVSGVLCAATVPLFDATLGRFSEYAIGVQHASPIVWRALGQIPGSPFGVAVLAAAILGWLVHRLDPAVTREAPLRRAAILAAAVSVSCVPGFIKYCGRDNNLTPMLVSGVFLVVLVWIGHQASGARRLSGVLGPLLAVLLVMWARPIDVFPDAQTRAQLDDDLTAVQRAIREDGASGRSTLPLLHAAAWISAGRRDVPHDRMLSALELWLAGRPEAEVLVLDLEQGKYDTVLAVGAQLRDDVDLRGRYDVRVLQALRRRYAVVYPPGEPDPTSVLGALVFRRRAAEGSAPAP